MSATIPTGTELRRAALKRIEGYVCKDRQATHGDAEDNFRQIAGYWKLYKGVEFTPLDVAAMMAFVKIARMATSPAHIDNWDDLAGYAVCGAGIVEATRLRDPVVRHEEPEAAPAGLSRAKCPECGHTIFFDLAQHWHTIAYEVIKTCPKCDTKFRPLVPNP